MTYLVWMRRLDEHVDKASNDECDQPKFLWRHAAKKKHYKKFHLKNSYIKKIKLQTKRMNLTELGSKKLNYERTSQHSVSTRLSVPQITNLVKVLESTYHSQKSTEQKTSQQGLVCHIHKRSFIRINNLAKKHSSVEQIIWPNHLFGQIIYSTELFFH